MAPPDPHLPVSRHAIAAAVLGGITLVASGPLLAVALACHTVYLDLHTVRYEVAALAASCVGLAVVPVSAWAYARTRRDVREGRARGGGLAGAGLAMTVFGFMAPFLGIVLIAGGAMVMVVLAWLSSLV